MEIILIKLFIDDERLPPDDGTKWIIIRTLDEFKTFVSVFGLPDFISFDHDLGEGEPTGYDISKWIVDYIMDNELPFKFDYYVHSQNPVGKKNIEALLDIFRKTWDSAGICDL